MFFVLAGKKERKTESSRSHQLKSPSAWAFAGVKRGFCLYSLSLSFSLPSLLLLSKFISQAQLISLPLPTAPSFSFFPLPSFSLLLQISLPPSLLSPSLSLSRTLAKFLYSFRGTTYFTHLPHRRRRRRRRRRRSPTSWVFFAPAWIHFKLLHNFVFLPNQTKPRPRQGQKKHWNKMLRKLAMINLF